MEFYLWWTVRQMRRGAKSTAPRQSFDSDCGVLDRCAKYLDITVYSPLNWHSHGSGFRQDWKSQALPRSCDLIDPHYWLKGSPGLRSLTQLA